MELFWAVWLVIVAIIVLDVIIGGVRDIIRAIRRLPPKNYWDKR